MIRFILCCTFIGLFFLCSIIFFPILMLIGVFNKKLRHRISLKMVKFAFSVILFISGTKTTVIGFENIPKDQAVLYVGNHRGFFDIIIGYYLVPDLTGFVAKKEVKKFPFLSQWMMLVNCLFLDRSNIKEGMKTILAGIDKLKSGISIFIFPEGTRGKVEGEVAEFKEGSFKMATKTGCPIVPVAFNNTGTIFEDQFPRVKKRHAIVEFCEPIYVNELDKEQQKFLGKYTHNIIQETVKKNNCQFNT